MDPASHEVVIEVTLQKLQDYLKAGIISPDAAVSVQIELLKVLVRHCEKNCKVCGLELEEEDMSPCSSYSGSSTGKSAFDLAIPGSYQLSPVGQLNPRRQSTLD